MKLIKDFKLNVDDFPLVLHARDAAALKWMLMDKSHKVTHSMRVAFLEERPPMVPVALRQLTSERATQFGPRHKFTRWVMTRFMQPGLREKYPA